MESDEPRLIALLESQHVFPGPYTFKVLYRNQPGTGEAILAAIFATTGHALVGEPQQRASSTARYVSLTFDLHLPEARAVLGVYQVLGGMASVVSYF